MSNQFPNHSITIPSIETVEGQEAQRRFEFELEGLDYTFVFSPQSDHVEEGATLTYVGDQERGRLSPREYAHPSAWEIADAKLAY